MEARHEMTAHIRQNRTAFLQIGMLISLLIVLGAFRWTTIGENRALDITEYNATSDSGLGEIEIEKEKDDEQLKEKSQPKPSDQFKLVDDKFKIVDTATLTTDPVKDPFTPGNITGALKDTMPEEIEGNSGVIPSWVEVMPKFPGGEDAMKKFIRDNYLVPYTLTVSGESIVFIQVKCVVEKDGSLSNVTVIKDGGYPEAAEAAIKTIERMPRWSPGYQGARAARVWVSIPIKIRIN